MAERLQRDSEMPLEAHARDATAALAAATAQNPAAASDATKDDSFINALITAPLQHGMALTASILEGLSGTAPQQAPFAAAPAASTSKFLPSAMQPKTPTAVPLVPLSYGQKKQAARRPRARNGKGDLPERAQLTRMSLRSPIKGGKFSLAAAQAPGTAELAADLAATLHAMQGDLRYDGGTRRLESDGRKNMVSAKAAKSKQPGAKAPI
jgi:hypothetical protein